MGDSRTREEMQKDEFEAKQKRFDSRQITDRLDLSALRKNDDCCNTSDIIFYDADVTCLIVITSVCLSRWFKRCSYTVTHTTHGCCSMRFGTTTFLKKNVNDFVRFILFPCD